MKIGNELIDKYSFAITTTEGTFIMGKPAAKHCALICKEYAKEAIQEMIEQYYKEGRWDDVSLSDFAQEFIKNNLK